MQGYQISQRYWYHLQYPLKHEPYSEQGQGQGQGQG